MTDFFIAILNMSITAAYVILAVLLLRLALRGLPKKYSYALWSVVGFRLVCPVSFKSVFSLFSLKPFDMTKAQQVNENALTYVPHTAVTNTDEVTVGVPYANRVIEQVTAAPAYERAINPLLIALTVVWLAGIVVLLGYAAVRLLQLKRALKTAVRYEGNVYTTDAVTSPFIVGILKPKIYLPSNMDKGCLAYVLAHERYHLKHFDNGVKLLAYLLLVLHWFNPLVWLAFYLMSKDMEMRCDEAVLLQNEGIKKAYSTALLSFATNKKFPAPSPLSFSENGVKARIQNVLKFKQPKRVVQALAIILCLSLLTACAANPKTTVTEKTFDLHRAGDDIYTATSLIGQFAALSYLPEDGSYYAKVTVKKNSLTIVSSDGETIFTSAKAETVPLNIKNENDVIWLGENEILISDSFSGQRYLFEDLNGVTCRTYSDGSQTYGIYFRNEIPFALLADERTRLYRLEPAADKDFVKETAEIVKMYYKDGPIFNEGNKIPLAKAKEFIQYGAAAAITDFQGYEYCNISSVIYDYVLDIADFNGYVEVTAPVEEGVGFDIELYYNDGSLLMSYSRPTYLGPPEGFAEEIQEDLADLKDIGLSADTPIIGTDEVNMLGIDGSMKEADIVSLLGQPKEIRDESDETLGTKAYVYDGVKISFIKTINGEPVTDMDEIYSAVFTDKGTAFPRIFTSATRSMRCWKSCRANTITAQALFTATRTINILPVTPSSVMKPIIS